MKIAQVSPLHESVPPKLYGGTERVVSYLTEELVNQGHEVTLFASGDSQTRARLVPCSPASLRLDKNCIDPLAHHFVEVDRVFQMADEFDVVHFHIDYLHFPTSRRVPISQLTTMHGRLDIPDLKPLFEEFNEMPVVSISDAQREPLAFANWLGTVYHGIPENLYNFHESQGKYLAFVGRISPEKRVDRAIEIAKRTGLPLKIAAKVADPDRKYYEEEIKPLMDHPLVEFIGEIGESEKDEFLGNAYAFVFPIGWPEPFGLAMIESMSTGTPVIAFRCGSVPEVIDEGETGFICDDIDQAVSAVEKVAKMSRRRVREVFERRFSASRMARDYVALYEQILGAREQPLPLAATPELARLENWTSLHYNGIH